MINNYIGSGRFATPEPALVSGARARRVPRGRTSGPLADRGLAVRSGSFAPRRVTSGGATSSNGAASSRRPSARRSTAEEYACVPFTCVNLRDPPLVVVGGSPTRPCDPQISQISQMGFRPLPDRQLSSWRAVHLRDSAQSVVREAPARSNWMNRRFRRFSQIGFSPDDESYGCRSSAFNLRNLRKLRILSRRRFSHAAS